MPVGNDVYVTLMSEVKNAREHFFVAVEHCGRTRNIANNAGTLTIQMVDLETPVAVHRYLIALKRFHEFILDGMVPEDLREPGE